MAEHHTVDVRVVGSTPISRPKDPVQEGLFFVPMAARRLAQERKRLSCFTFQNVLFMC